MKAAKRWGPWMLGLVAVLLAFLLLWPYTGWLVRAQFGGASFKVEEGGQVWLRTQVNLNIPPDCNPVDTCRDYNFCLVKALQDVPVPGPDGSRAEIRNLWAMVPRFPNEPGLYAHILRYYADDTVRLRRESEYMPEDWPALPGVTPTYSRPEDLEAFDKAAAAGERLDPRNAYFPYMRAAEFLEAQRVEDAAREMNRAAKADRWNDYLSQQVYAWEHTWNQMGVHPAVLERLAYFGDRRLPHLGLLRAAGRVLIHLAGQAEASGHVEYGLTLRHDVMKVGSLMRSDSPLVMCNIFGADIAGMPVMRPGGIPADGKSATGRTEEEKLARHMVYLRYLESNGHPAEAEWAKTEFAAVDRMKNVLDNGLQEAPGDPRQLLPLVIHWMLDVALLGNALWLLALAGMAGVMGFRRSRSKSAIALLAGVFLIAALGGWTWQGGWIDALYPGMEPMRGMMGSPPPAGLNPQMFAGSVAVPLLLIIGVSMRAFLRRKSVWRGVVGALQTTAPLIAGVLLLIYTAMIISTARLEGSVHSELLRYVAHSGRFIAEQTHQVWPGR